MAAPPPAQQPPPQPPAYANPPIWDKVEPRWDDGAPPMACYCKRLKADLLPGTFVLLSTPDTTAAESRNSNMHTGTVARIISADSSSRPPLLLSRTSVQVNIFKELNTFAATDGFLHPELLDENHLRHLREVVQTEELQVISSDNIINLAFVFTVGSLQDSCNLFFTCQGMAIAFVVRFRVEQSKRAQPMLIELPDGYCRPFPSSYPNSRYFDCFASRIWSSLICVKLEMTKLLGRYSHQQGLYGKEGCRVPNFTGEAWGFLGLQFSNLFEQDTFGTRMSMRIRRHRITESGLVVKAARVAKSCTILRFETKGHLKRLCKVFGESATAGQRCRLPKISSPKNLWKNDIINVVCGSDDVESTFNTKTVRDGIDLEFDGCSELFITVRYRRFTYTADTLVDAECDPLLSCLIRRLNPYLSNHELVVEEQENPDNGADLIIVQGSEFEDIDGCLYRVVSVDLLTHYVRAKCFYPRRNNALFGLEKSFDIDQAKEWIDVRLNG
jgi:hypothetical protein